jgi:hypothetical protein|tara:strand:+ start:114 stop:266 length:153 start_codon:yes stop_codon:yes gene_type:complete
MVGYTSAGSAVVLFYNDGVAAHRFSPSVLSVSLAAGYVGSFNGKWKICRI